MLPAERRDAELFPGPTPVPPSLGKTWPGNETLWASPSEPLDLVP